MTGTLIYHWTTIGKAKTALRRDMLRARPWAHYIEAKKEMVHGTSWSRDPEKWRKDNQICLVMAKDDVINPIYSIPGSRTFWLTKGMTDSSADPKAYMLESEEIDEEFIKGTLTGLAARLIGVFLSEECEDAGILDILASRRITILPQPTPQSAESPSP